MSMHRAQPDVVYISHLRTGSRSIRTTLFPDEPISPESPCYMGKSAMEVQEDFARRGWDWNRTFKFSVVRNPWDRLVSAHGFWAPTRGFKEWLFEFIDSDTASKSRLFDQSGALTDPDGLVLVDHIARFERLPIEWRLICAKIDLHPPLPRTHKSVHRHYSYYFDEASERLVEKACRRDLDLFNYQFTRLSRQERDKDHARYLYACTKRACVAVAKRMLHPKLRARLRNLK